MKLPENTRNVPSLFTCLDGTEAVTARDWEEKRRPEILEMMRREVYGRLPDMSGVSVSMRVTAERSGDRIMNGRAVRRTVEVEAVRKDRHFVFCFDVFIPAAAKKPVPAFIEICNRGSMACDPARELLNEFYPAETIISRGYACAAFRTHEVAPDYEEGFRTGFHRLFPEYAEDYCAEVKDSDARPGDLYGTITVWSWAASRILDYMETDPDIDEKRVAVVGHSRGGKTALWTGAQDRRFALAVSSCSGNSGTAISRGKTGESITQILDRFPFWFAKNYRRHAGHESEMPFDQHFLLALMAPRCVYISSKTLDAWADPRSEFESVVQASPAWQLYGEKGAVCGAGQLNAATGMPFPETPLHDGHIGYHFKTGDHNMTDYDWDRYMDFADKHM